MEMCSSLIARIDSRDKSRCRFTRALVATDFARDVNPRLDRAKGKDKKEEERAERRS